MEEKLTTFKFKDGTELVGTIVTQALCVIIVKVEGHFYLINKFKLVDED